MMWNERKDIILCRQILGERPHEHKKYSSEGKKVWGNIVKSLNTQEGFVVTVKTVRDHFSLLIDRRGKQKKSGGQSIRYRGEGKGNKQFNRQHK